jgi:hypothetical protein
VSAETLAYSKLTADPDIVALCDDRIYPDFVPQSVSLPAIAIIRTETDFTTTIHTGIPVAINALIEIWCLAATRAQAEQLGDEAIKALTDEMGEFVPVGRRPETETGPPLQFAAIVTVSNWEL